VDRQRIAELFEHAVELPVAEREAWLAAQCGSDDALRAEVERLLRADQRAANFMERPPALIAAAAADHDPAQPSRFGSYRVLRRLGVGGMGEVWLAERSDGEFEQRVAIKQVAYPTPGLLHRFRQERQILARLEHPNIARLIDGGVAADGTPYLVMEYIEGVPITAYAFDKALDIPARLRLFLRVCEAVQYAHQNLIVHRDLKPSNIFVTVEGTPKLLDFGIAKVLTTTDVDAPTQTIARLLTPDYAAPEQFTGAPVTTATDVYALGVVLYELLAGCRPRSTARDSAPAQSPRTADTLPPSMAVDRTTGNAASRRRALRGDLDRIAMNALERDPQRRYPTAEALAADIRHYLDGRPIAARRDSPWYRLRKFAMRNRYALAAASAVVAVSIAAAVVSTQQAYLAREQAARAEAARNFLARVFEQANPDENKGQAFTAHQLLEKGEAQLSSEGAHPAIRADMTGLIGSLYWNIGDYARAEPLLKSAVALGANPQVPADVRARNLVRLAWSEVERSLVDAAMQHTDEAIGIITGAGSIAARELAGARRLKAQIHTASGDADKAEPLLRELLASDRAEHGADSREMAEDWALLAHTLDELSRYDESIAAGHEALRIDRALHGMRSTAAAIDLNDLGLTLSHKGDYSAAEKALQEALDIKLQLYGTDHRETLTARANLFMAQEKQGRYAEGLSGRLQLLEDQKRLLGPDHADHVAKALNMIGLDYIMLGRFDEAETAFRESLATWKNMQGSSEEERIGPLGNLPIALQMKGDYMEAEKMLRETLELDRRNYPENSEWLNQDRGYLGNLLRLQHRYPEALNELGAAIAAVESAVSGADPVTVLLNSQLAEAQLDAGSAAKAHATATKALDSARTALPPRNIGLSNPLFALARANLALERAADAEPLLREALSVRSPPLAPNDPRVLEIKVALVNALNALDRTDEAHALRLEIEPPLRAWASPYAADLRDRLAER
jgi:eukaryotic-like serine/threonine-protein kinase